MLFRLCLKRRAFTLTEMTVVLGVFGLVLGSIWVAAGAANSKLKLNQQIIELNQIVDNARKVFCPNGACVSLAADAESSTDLAKNAGVFPTNRVNSLGKPVNIYGGRYLILSNLTGVVVQVEIPNSPSDIISSLMMRTAGSTSRNGLASISLLGDGGAYVMCRYPTTLSTIRNAISMVGANLMPLQFEFTPSLEDKTCVGDVFGLG